MGETPMKVQKVVHIIRPRAPMGEMVPFCGPWGSTFKVTRLDIPYSTLGTARGLPFAILETREALSEVAGRQV
jgi:hypothetical protein